MSGNLRIGRVASLLGVTPHYLRMLEWDGRVPAVGYDRAGRIYTAADVERLRRMGVGTRPRKLRRVDDAPEAAR